MTHRQELARVRARVDELEELCAAAYQLAGEVGAPTRILDALWAAAQGAPLPAVDWLPIRASECEEIETLRRQLEAVRRIVAIGPAAAELGRLRRYTDVGRQEACGSRERSEGGTAETGRLSVPPRTACAPGAERGGDLLRTRAVAGRQRHRHTSKVRFFPRAFSISAWNRASPTAEPESGCARPRSGGWRNPR